MANLQLLIALLGFAVLEEGIHSLPLNIPVEQGARFRRQIGGAMGDAMDRSFSNLTKGQIHTQGPNLYDGYFHNRRNFWGNVGGSAGTKVWQSAAGDRSVGVGIGGRADAGLRNGRPFVKDPKVGIGLGYQRGRFSTSVGMGRSFGARTSNSYGFGLSYRFRRAVPEADVEGGEPVEPRMTETGLGLDLPIF